MSSIVRPQRNLVSRLFKGPLLQIPAGHLHVFLDGSLARSLERTAGRAHGGRIGPVLVLQRSELFGKRSPFGCPSIEQSPGKKSEIEISKLKTNPRREGGNPNPLASLVSSLVSLSFSCRCWRWVFVLPCAVAGAASLQSFATPCRTQTMGGWGASG